MTVGGGRWPVWNTNSLSSGKCPLSADTDNLCSHIGAAFVPVFQEHWAVAGALLCEHLSFPTLMPSYSSYLWMPTSYPLARPISNAFFSQKWPWFPWTVISPQSKFSSPACGLHRLSFMHYLWFASLCVLLSSLNLSFFIKWWQWNCLLPRAEARKELLRDAHMVAGT